MTALRVAMRKMLEETIELTDLNMKEFRREGYERMKEKRLKMEQRFKKEMRKQEVIKAKHKRTSIAASSSCQTSQYVRSRADSFHFGKNTKFVSLRHNSIDELDEFSRNNLPYEHNVSADNIMLHEPKNVQRNQVEKLSMTVHNSRTHQLKGFSS